MYKQYKVIQYVVHNVQCSTSFAAVYVLQVSYAVTEGSKGRLAVMVEIMIVVAFTVRDELVQQPSSGEPFRKAGGLLHTTLPLGAFSGTYILFTFCFCSSVWTLIIIVVVRFAAHWSGIAWLGNIHIGLTNCQRWRRWGWWRRRRRWR